MNTTQIKTGAQGTILPPELQSAKASADSAADKAVAKEVKKAQRNFSKQLGKLGGVCVHDFYIRLLITLSFIWLKIGNKDSYVDEVMVRLNHKPNNSWLPARTTLQHYEGPLLRWLAELARQQNPTDPNLREKFSPTFLRQHPQYLLGVGKSQLKLIAKKYVTMTEFDKAFGNGCISAGKQRHKSAAMLAPNQNGELAKRKLRCKLTPTIRQPVVDNEGEADLPTNDGLLEQIAIVQKTLEEMKVAGIPVENDVVSHLMRCCMTAKSLQQYFQRPDASQDAGSKHKFSDIMKN